MRGRKKKIEKQSDIQSNLLISMLKVAQNAQQLREYRVAINKINASQDNETQKNEKRKHLKETMRPKVEEWIKGELDRTLLQKYLEKTNARAFDLDQGYREIILELLNSEKDWQAAGQELNLFLDSLHIEIPFMYNEENRIKLQKLKGKFLEIAQLIEKALESGFEEGEVREDDIQELIHTFTLGYLFNQISTFTHCSPKLSNFYAYLRNAVFTKDPLDTLFNEFFNNKKTIDANLTKVSNTRTESVLDPTKIEATYLEKVKSEIADFFVSEDKKYQRLGAFLSNIYQNSDASPEFCKQLLNLIFDEAFKVKKQNILLDWGKKHHSGSHLQEVKKEINRRKKQERENIKEEKKKAKQAKKNEKKDVKTIKTQRDQQVPPISLAKDSKVEEGGHIEKSPEVEPKPEKPKAAKTKTKKRISYSPPPEKKNNDTSALERKGTNFEKLKLRLLMFRKGSGISGSSGSEASPRAAKKHSDGSDASPRAAKKHSDGSDASPSESHKVEKSHSAGDMGSRIGSRSSTPRSEGLTSSPKEAYGSSDGITTSGSRIHTRHRNQSVLVDLKKINGSSDSEPDQEDRRSYSVAVGQGEEKKTTVRIAADTADTSLSQKGSAIADPIHRRGQKQGTSLRQKQGTPVRKTFVNTLFAQPPLKNETPPLSPREEQEQDLLSPRREASTLPRKPESPRKSGQ